MSKEVQPFQEAAPATIANAGMQSGGAIASLVPQNLEDAFRLSKALSSAGDMVPESFRGNPEATMAAIIRGMEIGLAPMQALSNIAVINGRASLWGDSIPALMQRSGHHIDVVIEGEGDAMKAVATLERGDTGKRYVREFSVADAKAANLWGKKGPWQTYPKRMLTHRARSWAVRDGAADALMGLQIAEEMQDVPPPRDVTPREAKPGGFAARAQAARQQAEPEDAQVPTDAAEDPTSDEQHTDTLDGEVLPNADEDAAPDEQQGHGSTEQTEAYLAGAAAFGDGFGSGDCPHKEDGPDNTDWLRGWNDAYNAADQEGGDA